MYNPEQIVWSVKDRKPVNCDNNISQGKTTHFIDANGKIICPRSVKEAETLLERNMIVPAPTPPSTCWSCDRRKGELPGDACEAKEDHIRCSVCSIGTIYGIFRGTEVCRDCCNSLSKNQLQSIIGELSREAELMKQKHDTNSQNVSKLIQELVEFDDPYLIKRDGEFRDRLEKMDNLYYKDRHKK